MQKRIVANWKMHKTIGETRRFIDELRPVLAGCEAKVMLAVPFTALWNASKQAEGTFFQIGAQNIDFHPEGAFTGEISAGMVKDAGAGFVICGHSERRRLYLETSPIVNLKVKAALTKGLVALVCIGETIEEREAGIAEETLRGQIVDSLQGLSSVAMSSVILAYEPIWAIGKGQAATSEDVTEVHAFCREVIADRWGLSTATDVPIVYGGSVNPDNACELLETPEVDGLLVGGASLSVNSFSKIVLAQQLNLS